MGIIDTTVVLDVDSRFGPTAALVAAVADLGAEVGDMMTLVVDDAWSRRESQGAPSAR